MIDTEDFEKNMAVFNFAQHQDFLTYFNLLQKFNWTFNDVKKYIQTKNKNSKRQVKNILSCPNCQTPMILYPVNTTPATQTGDNSKSVWTCPKCNEDRYSTKSIQDWVKELKVSNRPFNERNEKGG